MDFFAVRFVVDYRDVALHSMPYSDTHASALIHMSCDFTTSVRSLQDQDLIAIANTFVSVTPVESIILEHSTINLVLSNSEHSFFLGLVTSLLIL